jgi:hypothetical protein
VQVLIDILERSRIPPDVAVIVALFLAFLPLFPLARRALGSGWVPKLRYIPAFERIEDSIVRALENGRALHLSLGTKGIGGTATVDSMAGLMVLESVAERAVGTGLKLIVTVADPSLLPLAQDILRRMYERKGYGEGYDSSQVRLIAPQTAAYAAGVMGILEREDVEANIMVGAFGDEFLLMGESGVKRGLLQVGGTSSPEVLPFVYTSTDESLLGEEIYAAGAYLSAKESHLASLLAQDWLRLALILAIIAGAVVRSIFLTGGK